MATLTSHPMVPDSLLAKEATDLLREYSTELLFNHSMRVYLFAAEQGRQEKLGFDPNSYTSRPHFTISVSLRRFSSEDQRFEVDGANAARQFLHCT